MSLGPKAVELEAIKSFTRSTFLGNIDLLPEFLKGLRRAGNDWILLDPGTISSETHHG